MSLILSQVSRIDAQLDRIHLLSSPSISTTSSSPSTAALQSSIKALSIDPSSSRPLLPASSIRSHLSPLLRDDHDSELAWLLLAKASTQAYGLVIDRLLRDTLSIAEEGAYWDAVLRSWWATGIYGVQTSPGRIAGFVGVVAGDVREKIARFDVSSSQEGVKQHWERFYGLVRESVRERSVRDVRREVVGPIARLRGEIRTRTAELKKARLRGANALGVLLGEGMMNEVVHGDGLATPSEDQGRRWKGSVARNVALMEAVLAKVHVSGLEVEKFDAAIAEETDGDVLFEADVGMESITPGLVAERLATLMGGKLSAYDAEAKGIVKAHGRPSRLVRYWLPVTLGILSSSTVLRILVNRKAEIVTWLEDFGSTVIDFWRNWVIEPTRKVIKTIRHDEGSEVSIMSKRSLEGDRDSLERMVVDFARENPADGQALSDAQLADIRAKVREGDLTPVLKAYEKDLASPFMGTIRGNLIRALLIQVQKTKVDVEVAMGGIDALLKSQELVFGFVGLTPGILVTVALWRWLSATIYSDKSSKDKHGAMVRQLRNIDRVLTNSTPTNFGELFYKDHGLLLCEVHVLRQEAQRSMPDQVYREFMEEVEELVDVRSGIKRQKAVVERIRWAFAQWF